MIMDEIKMEFLTPTDKDNFKVEKQGENKYKVYFKDSFVIAEILKDGFSFIEMEIKSEYEMKKLNGYVIFKLFK